jgi:hypothetical protein
MCSCLLFVACVCDLAALCSVVQLVMRQGSVTALIRSLQLAVAVSDLLDGLVHLPGGEAFPEPHAPWPEATCVAASLLYSIGIEVHCAALQELAQQVLCRAIVTFAVSVFPSRHAHVRVLAQHYADLVILVFVCVLCSCLLAVRSHAPASNLCCALMAFELPVRPRRLWYVLTAWLSLEVLNCVYVCVCVHSLATGFWCD